MKNDFVVERATVERVRMTDESSVAGVGCTRVEQSLKPTSWTVEKE